MENRSTVAKQDSATLVGSRMLVEEVICLGLIHPNSGEEGT
jgi:hypothetical protein